MTEEIKLGVYERLLNDYESDKEKHAADLAYAACCLVDTVTSEEIAGNENAVTFAVGLPLALSGIDEEIWKGYLSKPVNGTEKLKEFLEGVNAWNRGNLSEDSDFDRLFKVCERLSDNWYSKYFAWFKFFCIEADFENNKDDTEKWLKEASSLWEQSKNDRFKTLLCLNAFFYGVDDKGNYGDYSLCLEKPSKKSKEPCPQSFYLAQKIIEDSIKIFTAEKKQDPFGLFLLGFLLKNAGWEEPPNCKYIFELCINGRLSQAAIYLVGLLDEDEQEYHQEAYKWYEKGAQMGNPYIQNIFASMNEKGNGVAQNLSKAREWNLEAIAGLVRLGNRGDLLSMIFVAEYYTNGAEGIPVNTSEALKWYKRALPIAEKHKDTESQQKILIGIYEIYSNNQEWKDMKKLESEAQSGDVAAMQAIGDLYLKGDTCPQDLNESCKWYKKAAEHIEKPFFVLAIKGYENYMQDSEYCKVDKAFRRIVEKALDKKIVHTEEFLACYRFMPGGKDAKEAIKRVRDCFYKHDPKFVEEIEELIGTELSRHWGEWPIGVKREIREYLEELFLVTLEKPPKDLAEFIKNKGGKLKGFGLAQLSQQCVLLRPDFYLVMNNATYFAESVKKDKKLRISDNDYTNYPLLCEKIVNDLGPLGFSSTYLGHVFDRLVCKWAEGTDKILSETLVENFRTLVSRLLGITENRCAVTKEVKTQNDSDIEIQDLDSIFHELLDQARGKLEGKQSESILLDSLKRCLVSKGRKWHDEYERRFQLWLKQNLPQNPNTKI